MSENSTKSEKKIITMGEIMLRLKSPGHERLLQNSQLEATFGGSESNVAVSLANYGLNTKYVTALPENALGDSVIRSLRAMNVDTSDIVRQGSRLGIYFVETGSGPRPSMVIYDRANSSISQAKVDDFNWDSIFNNAQWFHTSGITAAISQNAADLTINAVKMAKEKGLKTSCDLNFRKKLWKYGKSAPEVMNQLMPYLDVIIANEEDIQNSLGLKLDQKIGGTELDKNKYELLCKRVLEQYPNVQVVLISLRESFSADHNDWSGMCFSRSENKAFYSKKYSLKDIVDRVGGGDSFGAGFLYGLITSTDFQFAVDFAVAASALKHTIPGDINRVSTNEVLKLMGGDASGRVQR